VNCWLTQVATLHRCNADGSVIHPISANIEHDNTPWVLPDGRIIYQRWEYIDRSQVNYHHLWTSNPDGTNQMPYFGNLTPGLLMIDARPIPGSDDIVTIFSPGHGAREHAGRIVLLTPNLGPDDPKAVRVLSPNTGFRDPWAFAGDSFIAARDAEILAINGSGSTVLLHVLSDSDRKEGYWIHEPRPVLPQATAKIIPDRTDPAKANGKLILANVMEGRNMSGVKPGEIRKLRLWIETAATYPGTYASLGTGMIGGYQENKQVHTDGNWPTTRAGAQVVDRKCSSCHGAGGLPLVPRTLSDERGVSFWMPKIPDPTLVTSRHLVFNLSRPEKSLMLLAPLSRSAGGYQLCHKPGNAAPVFADTGDPGYQTLLAMIASGKRDLEAITRFDMSDFKPHPAYVRKMKRYGILPADLPSDASINPYQTDRRYWESLWYQPVTATSSNMKH